MYFKIGSYDISDYVSELTIDTKTKYVSQTNAIGDTRVDALSSKRVFTIKIIPIDDTTMATILGNITFSCSISYRDPKTNNMVNNVSCICPDTSIEYYTIQTNNVSYKAWEISFEEL